MHFVIKLWLCRFRNRFASTTIHVRCARAKWKWRNGCLQLQAFAVDVFFEAHSAVVELEHSIVWVNTHALECVEWQISFNQSIFAHVNVRSSHSFRFAYQMGQIICKNEWHLNLKAKLFGVAFENVFWADREFHSIVRAQTRRWCVVRPRSAMRWKTRE